MRLPINIPRKEVLAALSNKPDVAVSKLAFILRKRFAHSVCKNLLGCTIEQAQRKTFKNNLYV
jgi:hypothetical protein